MKTLTIKTFDLMVTLDKETLFFITSFNKFTGDFKRMGNIHLKDKKFSIMEILNLKSIECNDALNIFFTGDLEEDFYRTLICNTVLLDIDKLNLIGIEDLLFNMFLT